MKDTQGQIELMLVLARLGRGADAVKIADVLTANTEVAADRRLYFQAACGYAVAAATPGPAANGYRDKAIGMLDSLTQGGWKDRGALETDPDLTPVRDDPRFAKLVERVPR